MQEENRLRREDVSVRMSFVIIGTLMILAAGLRFYRLDNGLWFDEIATLIGSVRPPLLHIITSYRGDNDHTFYSVLAHISIQVFGEHAWSLRFPAAILGVASVPLLFLVGKSITSRLEAILACTILTFSYHHVWFSQNARAYTGLLVCVLLATFFLLRWFQNSAKSNLVGYSITVALGAYFQLSMVMVAVSHAMVAAFQFFRPGRPDFPKQNWKDLALPFVSSGALTVILYAPMMKSMLASMAREGVTSGVDFATPLWAIGSALRGLQIGLGSLWIIVIGMAIFAAGALSYLRQNSTVLLLLLLPGMIVLTVALLLGHTTRPRFFFFSIGFGLLIIVRGASVIGSVLGRLVARWLTPEKGAVLAAVGVTALGVLFSVRSLPYGYRYPKQDFVRAGEFVENSKVPTDKIAAVGDSVAIPMMDYLGKSWTRIEHLTQLVELQSKGNPVWVVYTFPEYIELSDPGLWKVLQNDCQNAAEFTGTVDGGEIMVTRCGPGRKQLN